MSLMGGGQAGVIMSNSFEGVGFFGLKMMFVCSLILDILSRCFEHEQTLSSESTANLL